MSELPHVMSSATVRIMGVDLTVHVLDDGQRVIDSESVGRLFTALVDLDTPPMTEDEAVGLAKVIRLAKP